MIFKNLLAIAIAIVAFHASAKPVLIEGILASVNDDIILLSEFRNRQLQALRSLKQQKIAPESVPNLKSRLLESMINERLELEVARSQNIQVTDLVLNREISKIGQNNNMTVIELKSAIEQQGEDWKKYIETLRHQILLGQLKNQVLAGKVNVTDQEIEQFLGRERSRNDPFEYEVSQILIENNDTQRTQEQSVLKAQDIYEKLSEGMPFASASAQYSDASNALDGGDLGWLDASNLPYSFLQALQQLEPNEFSLPIQSGLGYHILLLKKSRHKKTVILNRYKLQQIFLSSLNHNDEDAFNTLDKLSQQIENNPENFSSLAEKHSEDGISASNDGLTPWLISKRFDPELEKSIQSLKIQQLSKPIRTQNGWYLVKVLNREEFDATKVISRERVRNFLINQQAEVEYANFLRNLRNSAAVNIQQAALNQL